MVRKQVLAANWKMYKTRKQAREFVEEFLPLLKAREAEIIICPPATLLAEMASLLQDSPVKLGAQNIHWQPEGAYTGDISAAMAQDAGADYVLCGHSERRQYYGENSAQVAQKAQAALAQGLKPIICLGETLQERQSGQALAVLHDDIQASLAGIAPQQLIIAYEPVWAIGTGQVATPDDAEQAIAHIRQSVAECWGDIAASLPILYGGSVKPENIAELLACPNIDGALVGGASLQGDKFAAIVNAAR